MDKARSTSPSPLVKQENFIFWLIMAVALVPRLVAAFSYSVNHPDQLYQYLEPAHRMLFGYGTITWEFRDGIRSWLPAWIFSGPMALGDMLSPQGNLAVYLPRVLMATLSLSLVWSAWALGRRQSLFDAIIAASIAALWAEFINYAPHTLTEQLATVAIIPALVILTDDKPRFRLVVLAGILLGLGAVFRPHYLPAIGLAVLMTARTQWKEYWIPLLLGGGLALALSAAVDWNAGQYPFEWMVNNYRRNIIDNVAARYGVSPWHFYIGAIGFFWSFVVFVLFHLAWSNPRREFVFLVVGLVTIAVHSLIGHKEYRFIVLGTAAFMMMAAPGGAAVVRQLAQRMPSIRYRTVAISFIMLWAFLSSWRLATFQSIDYSSSPVVAKAMDLARKDPNLCGFGAFGYFFGSMPGYSRLHRPVPLIVNEKHPEAVDPQHFNWAVAKSEFAPAFAKDFSKVKCTADGEVCVYRRRGSCASTRSSFELNSWLEREGI